MSKQKTLVPYNFTIHDKKVLDFIINFFGGKGDISFTFLHLYTPLPEIDKTATALPETLRKTLLSLSQEVRQEEKFLKETITHLIDNGFAPEQLDYILRAKKKDIAEEIMDTALEGYYDMVILNHKPGKVIRLFGKSVSHKLLSSIEGIAITVVS